VSPLEDETLSSRGVLCGEPRHRGAVGGPTRARNACRRRTVRSCGAHGGRLAFYGRPDSRDDAWRGVHRVGATPASRRP